MLSLPGKNLEQFIENILNKAMIFTIDVLII